MSHRLSIGQPSTPSLGLPVRTAGRPSTPSTVVGSGPARARSRLSAVRRLRTAGYAAASVALLVSAPACATGDDAPAGEAAFAALQERGRIAMGVDQYTSTHRFDALPDGGRIELQRDVDDPEGVRTIREHLRGIANAFASGDFSTPAFVHMRDVPGAAVMAARRDAIRYVYSDLPRGGEVRIATDDPEAIRAIHEFMAFQRDDHRAGGATPDGMDHGAMDHGAMDHGAMDHGAMDHGSMDHGSMDHGSMDHGSMDHDGSGHGSAGAPAVDGTNLDSIAHEQRHREEMASIEDRDLATDLDLVHQLVVAHRSIRREVTNLPDGIRTLTESDDPRIAAYIVEHVERMDRRLVGGDVFNLNSPNLPFIFENADRIRTTIERTPNGVLVIQTSDDPATVAALQAHAAEVDELVRDGMAAMMRGSGAAAATPAGADQADRGGR